MSKLVLETKIKPEKLYLYFIKTDPKTGYITIRKAKMRRNYVYEDRLKNDKLD